MNTELLIKKASDHGLHDLASQILNALDGAIFGGAPVADTADYIHDIEHEIECLVDEIEEENHRTPTAHEIAVKNPFFCESCED
jgi:hypothetical protein